MSLAFGPDEEPDLIGAPSVPDSLVPRNGDDAAAAIWARPVSLSHDFRDRATASPGNHK